MPAKNTIDLSIIVVNYNSGVLLRKNICSLIKHIRNLRYEIIVVDNGSTDNSLDFITKDNLPVSIIYNEKNLGFSKANNIGILRAEGKAVILLNQDVRISNDILSPMYKAVTEDPEIGLLGCKIEFPDGRVQTSAYSFTSFGKQFLQILLSPVKPFTTSVLKRLPILCRGKIIRTHIMNYLTDKKPVDVDYVTGACVIFRKEIIERIGLLDEKFFMYYEDEDFCRRAKNSGLRVVYMPSVSVTHEFGWRKNKVNIALVRERQKSFNHYCNKYYHNRRIYYRIYSMFNALLFTLKLISIKSIPKQSKACTFNSGGNA